METLVNKSNNVDIEQGGHRRSSAGDSDADNYSSHSHRRRKSRSESGGGGGGGGAAEIVGVADKSRGSSSSSSSSECSIDQVDLEEGIKEVHLGKVEEDNSRDCRICHLSLDLDSTNQDSGAPFELGCSCKEDLAAAHKHCAEAWFKIKGNKTCEICGSVARNVAGASEAELLEQWNEANDAATAVPSSAPLHSSATRSFWQGHRFLNFLLACMVFAFVISWLFHFNVPS